MQQVVGSDGYMDRRYRYLTELNLRRAYEDHGMFKVQFPSIQAEEVNSSTVNVTTGIVEGLQYKLADVILVGDDLPSQAMLAAGHFKKGRDCQLDADSARSVAYGNRAQAHRL